MGNRTSGGEKKEEKQSHGERPVSDEERIKKIGKMLQDLKVGSEELAKEGAFQVNQTENVLYGMSDIIDELLKESTKGGISPESTALLNMINGSLITLKSYYKFLDREIDKYHKVRYNPKYITKEGIPPIIRQLSVNIQTLLNNFEKRYKVKKITEFY